MFKWVMRAHFKHAISKGLLMIERTLQFIEFWPLKLLIKNLVVHLGFQLPRGEFTWECEGSFPHTFSHFESMKYDSWGSLMAHTLASPCLGREPKVRVVTLRLTTNHVMSSWTRSLTTSLPLSMKVWMLLVLTDAKVETDIKCLGLSDWHLRAKWRFKCIKAMCLWVLPIMPL